jgi:DNA-binding transcriptional MocR family regulator
MNSGPTSERVYDAIKRRILSREFRPGERLDPALLAPSLSSSITPIRDALHLLTGQGLVETGTSEGFRLPHIDEPALKDLYAWNLEVLTLAIRSWPRGGVPAPDDDSASDPAHEMAALGIAIAQRSGNAEHMRAILSLNDRLQPLRVIEVMVIEPVEGEMAGLGTAIAEQDETRLRRLLLDYHRRRQRKAAEIVRTYYRI